MLEHCALVAQYVHPALTWCYAGEDMMGRVQRMVKACVRGATQVGSMSKATKHYMLGMHLRFESY